MKNNRVDGIIASLGANTTSYDHFTALKKYNIPVVFFDRVPTLPEFNKVYSNMNSGTREAIEFLIEKGHRRIGVINGPEKMRSSIERTDTYKQALIKRRLKIDLGLVTKSSKLSGYCTNNSATSGILSRRAMHTIRRFL